jgi:hypothetical protein
VTSLAVASLPLAIITAAISVAAFSHRTAPYERLHRLVSTVVYGLRGTRPPAAPLTLRPRPGPATIGGMRWVGPNGEIVDVIRLRGKDGVTRELYRLRRHGRFVANCATPDELAEYVDPATLTEEDDRAR